MKNLIAAVVLMVAGSSAFAQSNPVLKNDMSQLGNLFTEIYNNLSDATMSKQLAADAGQMVSIFGDALKLVPATISALPPSQQAAAIADYQSIIQDEITSVTALQAAFLKGDLTTAQALFTKMNQDKNQGHSKYKPATPAGK